MCVIIHKPKDRHLSYRTLRRAYRANPHGWGLCALDDDGNMVVERGLGAIGELIAAFKKHESKEVVIHCRIKTHGEINLENTHPFVVNDDMWLFHNGRLLESTVPIRDKAMSDTWHYAEKLRATLETSPLLGEFPQFKLIDSIEKDVGYSNKIVLVSRKLGVLIANRKAGEEKEGVWFSNTSAFRDSKLYKSRTLGTATGTSTTARPVASYPGVGHTNHYGGYAGTSTPGSGSGLYTSRSCYCREPSTYCEGYVCQSCLWKKGFDPGSKSTTSSPYLGSGNVAGTNASSGNKVQPIVPANGDRDVRSSNDARPTDVPDADSAKSAEASSASVRVGIVDELGTAFRATSLALNSLNVKQDGYHDIVVEELEKILNMILLHGTSVPLVFRLVRDTPYLATRIIRGLILGHLDGWVFGQEAETLPDDTAQDEQSDEEAIASLEAQGPNCECAKQWGKGMFPGPCQNCYGSGGNATACNRDVEVEENFEHHLTALFGKPSVTA